MLFRSQFLYRPKLAMMYLLARSELLRNLVPEHIRQEVPTGWSDQMFWTGFKSRGETFYYDFPIKMKRPTSYKPKITVGNEFKLTEGDIRFFYKHGYIKPFRVMSEEDAHAMHERMVRLVNEQSSQVHPRGTYEYDNSNRFSTGTTEEESLAFLEERLKARNRHLDEPVLLELFKHPAIVERCAQLLGGNLLLWRSVFFQVPPKSPGTEWHQGSTWMMDWKEHTLFPPKLDELFQVSAWIAFTDTTKESACLKTVSNTQWDVYPFKIKKNSTKPSMTYGDYDAEIQYPVTPENENYIEMKAGECTIFSERVMHGSSDNETDRYRWAVSGRIVRTDTRVYSENMLKHGSGTKAYGLKNLNLDNWRAVLIRGQDTYGYNRLLDE